MLLMKSNVVRKSLLLYGFLQHYCTLKKSVSNHCNEVKEAKALQAKNSYNIRLHVIKSILNKC